MNPRKQLKDTWTAAAGWLEKSARVMEWASSWYTTIVHKRHPVQCWNAAKSTLSWVGQLLGPGIHPHHVGTRLSCKQSLNQGQLVLILHVAIPWYSMPTAKQRAASKITCLSGVITYRSYRGIFLQGIFLVPSFLVPYHRDLPCDLPISLLNL